MTMRQRNAKVAELNAQRDPWDAPDWLTPDEAAIWGETVSAMGADHFQQGDLRVLADWCRGQARLSMLTVAQRRLPIITKDDDKRSLAKSLSAQVSALRAALATQTRMLRLAPSTRFDRDRNTGMPTRNPGKGSKRAATGKTDPRGPIGTDLLP
jgi:phage terminase small subunit